MKTLKELIVEKKCRKGARSGIEAKKGAYWLALEPFQIRRFGGDGVGQSRADRTNYLELRHYRSGAVEALVKFSGWHQNAGTFFDYVVADILAATTVEEVILTLKGTTLDEAIALADNYQSDLTESLVGLGLEIALPGPDENPNTVTDAGNP